MSETAPIGSVEFIVKFDTMQHEFNKVLRDAIKDSDIDVEFPEDIRRKIDRIIFNLEQRIRHPTTVHRKDFEIGAVQQKAYLQEEETKQSLADWFASDFLETKKDETLEEKRKRAEEWADMFLNRYESRIDKGIKDIDFWDKYKVQFVNWEKMFDLGLKGSWGSFIKVMMQQIFDEKELQDAWKRVFESIEEIYIPPKERRQSKLRQTLRSGGEKEEKVSTTTGIIETLQEFISFDLIKESLQLDPNVSKGTLEELKNKWNEGLVSYFDKYEITEGTEIPNLIGKIMGKFLDISELPYGSGEGEYKRLDFFTLLKGLEGVVKYQEMLEKIGVNKPEIFEEWMENLKEKAESGVSTILDKVDQKIFGGPSVEALNKFKYGQDAQISAIVDGTINAVVESVDIASLDDIKEIVQKELVIRLLKELKAIQDTIESNEYVKKALEDWAENNPEKAKKYGIG